MAGAEGFEPPKAVLETAGLPLAYAPRIPISILRLFTRKRVPLCGSSTRSPYLLLAKPNYYSMISLTVPAPTVRPPSRIAKRRPLSIATGVISSISSCTLSPGITISVPAGNCATPVTSVVRK